MSDNDPYWDDLGVAWRVVKSDSVIVAARLRAQIKRQMWSERLALAVGMLAALGGIGVGVALLKEAAPGVKLIGAIAIAGIAVLLALYPWVRGQAISGDTATLIGMIDVAIAQASRRQRDVKAGYVGVVILVLVGALIAYLWRFRLHLPGIQAMMLMAASLAIAIVLCVEGHHHARKSRDRQARFEHLKRALSASDE